MSATPRTIRAVAMPAAPRIRRVVGVHARPFGTITLFLIATTILGITSLLYVWEAGQRTAAGMVIQQRQALLQNAYNAQQDLINQINKLTSTDTVLQVATTRYHMHMPADPSTVDVMTIPQPSITRIIPMTAPARPAGVSLRVTATDAAVTSWWQDAWALLYRLLR